MKAKGPWLVAKCDLTTSSIHGGDMTIITMINQNYEIAHTYIEHTNKNYKNWQPIIQGFDLGWGITIDNLRYKVKNKEIQKRHIRIYNTKENLIDADSQPKSVEVLETLAELIAEFFRTRD